MDRAPPFTLTSRAPPRPTGGCGGVAVEVHSLVLVLECSGVLRERWRLGGGRCRVVSRNHLSDYGR